MKLNKYQQKVAQIEKAKVEAGRLEARSKTAAELVFILHKELLQMYAEGQSGE